MIHQVKSRKKIADVARDLEVSAQRRKFGVLGVHDLRAKMREKGVDFERDCLILEVCNPHQAKKVLDRNPEISTALPCRISVFSQGESVILATMKPTAMIASFGDPGLEAVAREVEETLFIIMDEAAGS